MRRLIKLILILVVLGFLALVAFAYLGPVLFPAEFAPPLQEIRDPVTLGRG